MMRNVGGVAALLAAAFFSGQAFAGGKVGGDCTHKGIPLYGKVQVVNAFPDFKVKTVDAFADLDVQEVTAFPDSCGKWQFVQSGARFKVQFVDAFEDFRIRRVGSFPGVR